MNIAIQTNTGSFIRLEGDDLTQALELFSFEVKRIRLMIAFDVGWTGMIIKAAGRKVALYDSMGHIVDCSEQIQY